MDAKNTLCPLFAVDTLHQAGHKGCNSNAIGVIEMSDTAFKTASYPGLTTAELKKILTNNTCINPDKITAEINRRARAAEGDQSVMTQGERLRFLRTGNAR
jgi:hypothetical protein